MPGENCFNEAAKNNKRVNLKIKPKMNFILSKHKRTRPLHEL